MDRYVAKQGIFLITRILQLAGYPAYFLIEASVWMSWWIWHTSIWIWQERYRKATRFYRSMFEHRMIRTGIGFALILGCLGLTSIGTDGVQADFSQIDPELTIKLSDEASILTTRESVRAPVDHMFLTQGYRPGHYAIDIAGSVGDPIYPIMRGRVKATIHERKSYGNHVYIDHGGGLESLYAHLSWIDVKEGDIVTIDDSIGGMGKTGNATGVHLHLEILDQGRQVNPITVVGGK